MASVKQLTSDAGRLRDQASDKLKEAERATQSAVSYSANGQKSEAQSQNNTALRLQQDANSMQQQAIDIEQQAIDVEKQIQDIEQRETVIRAELSDLERQKNSLK